MLVCRCPVSFLRYGNSGKPDRLWDFDQLKYHCVDAVDGDPVPVPHFGLALGVDQFHELAERVQKAGINFILEPHLRFKGTLSILLSFSRTETRTQPVSPA